MNGLEKPVFKIGLWDYVDQPRPPFGHAMHEFFSFDPGYINLNDGAFGSLPTPVHRACAVLTDKIEANPDKFVRLEYHPLLLSVRERLAKLIGADMEECVLVSNASTAAGIILRGVDWKAGDVLIAATTTYANVVKTVQYVHDLNPQTTLSIFPLAFPMTHKEILESFEAHLDSIPRSAPTEQNPNPKVFCVLDSIISNPGILLPWKEMVKMCKDRGIYSIVDAAHSIGQEVDLNLAETQPDFWFSNCHKWLYAKRACAVLYVPKRNQHLLKSSFPTSQLYVPSSQAPVDDWIDSSASRCDWATQFEWTGTVDLTPYLSIGAALDFRDWLGGEEEINKYCHDLALRGGKRLAEILGTSLMDQSENSEETLNMVNVELPLKDVPLDKINFVQDTLQDRLLKEYNAYAAHFYHNGRFWARCSAQIWNEVSDFEYIGRAFQDISRLEQNYSENRVQNRCGQSASGHCDPSILVSTILDRRLAKNPNLNERPSGPHEPTKKVLGSGPPRLTYNTRGSSTFLIPMPPDSLCTTSTSSSKSSCEYSSIAQLLDGYGTQSTFHSLKSPFNDMSPRGGAAHKHKDYEAAYAALCSSYGFGGPLPSFYTQGRR
ncbi:hypothetical protein NM688_g1347 [Phlebia brevispora]|uniref:Uncharacterized protein n=1 Tax=Phlebia brevispora TaxID=194682 RepID=A0ACC1TBV0_9APHY|nr:hypothetical protein NM688_g1347 [Phlebia brevispora]